MLSFSLLCSYRIHFYRVNSWYEYHCEPFVLIYVLVDLRPALDRVPFNMFFLPFVILFRPEFLPIVRFSFLPMAGGVITFSKPISLDHVIDVWLLCCRLYQFCDYSFCLYYCCDEASFHLVIMTSNFFFTVLVEEF